MNDERFEGFNPSICISNKVRKLGRVVANIYRKHLSPFGITGSQVSILFVLSKRKSLTQNELCKILLLEKSSLNRNLNRLFERALISKDEFPQIQMTAKGFDLVEEIIPEWEKAMTETKNLINNDGVLAIDLLSQKLH